MRYLVLCCLSLLSLASCTPQAEQKAEPTIGTSISSPKQSLFVKLQGPDSLASIAAYQFKVFRLRGKDTVLAYQVAGLGLAFQSLDILDSLLYRGCSAAKQTAIQYSKPHGKCAVVDKLAFKKEYYFVGVKGDTLTIETMTLDDGFAFRYSIGAISDSSHKQTADKTILELPEGTSEWKQAYNSYYEGFYESSTADSIREFGFPLLAQANENTWVLWGETGMDSNNCGWHLAKTESELRYSLALPEYHGFYKAGIEPRVSFPWKSPWRFGIVGDLPTLFASTIVHDLAPACKIGDPSWVEPGLVSWVYWAHNHGSKDFLVVKDYIDLADSLNWPYVLIDWEWDVMENGGTVEEACQYALAKGVKPLLWYNSGASWLEPTPNDRILGRAKRQKEMDWLNKIGCAGIKVDFFAGDLQEMMKLSIEILEDAAAHNLLVNFHGAPIPRGWQRSYPNLMTTEAVFGAEWYNNNAEMTSRGAWHNTLLPFTRNIVGSMDYTPTAFTNSQHPHTTTNAHELALSIVFESALQHMADRPAGFYQQAKEVQSLLSQLPAAWDESRLLSGFPGKHAVVARRKNKDWYIAGINGQDQQTHLQLDLSFLEMEKNTRPALLFQDQKAANTIKASAIEASDLANSLNIIIMPRGGFVLKVPG